MKSAAVGILVVFFAFARTASASGAPPVGTNDFYTVSPGKTLKVSAPHGLLTNDSDPEADRLTAILVRPPFFGTLNLKPDGSFTYTSRNSAGGDFFYYWAYDGTSKSLDVISVTIRIVAPPVALGDSWAVLTTGSLSVAAPGVLVNDYSIGSGIVGAELVKTTTRGTLQLQADGGFSYVPKRGFIGDDFFIYRASDGVRKSHNARVTLHVVKTNIAPIGQPETYKLFEDNPLSVIAPGLLANDTDADGHTLHAEVVSYPGPVDSFEFFDDGSFFLQPVLSWDSDFTFSYRVTDGISYSPPITVTIDMVAFNNPPMGEDDYYEMVANSVLEIGAPGVLANDSDQVEFDSVRVFDVVTPPGHGSLILRPDGSFTYTPEAGFVGNDGFSYRPADSSPGNVTNVTIAVFEL